MSKIDKLIQEDSVSASLLALHETSVMTDDLYAVIGEDSSVFTEDDFQAILNSFEVISEIYEKYEDVLDMPSAMSLDEDLDEDLQEAISETLEIVKEEFDKKTVATLTKLGFSEVPKPFDSIWKPSGGRKIVQMFGIKMRAGKFADTFFAFMGDDSAKPYVIADNEGLMEFRDLKQAIAQLKKMATNEDTIPLARMSDFEIRNWLRDNYSDEKGTAQAAMVRAAIAVAKQRKIKWQKKGRRSFFTKEDIAAFTTEEFTDLADALNEACPMAKLNKIRRSIAGFEKKLEDPKIKASSKESIKKILKKLDGDRRICAIQVGAKNEELDEARAPKIELVDLEGDRPFGFYVSGLDADRAVELITALMPGSKLQVVNKTVAFKTTKGRDAAVKAIKKYYKNVGYAELVKFMK